MDALTPRKIEILPGLSNREPLLMATETAKAEGFMLPGVDLIGRGYDVVNGEYACQPSTLDKLFDIKDRIGPGDRDDFPERANAYATFEQLYGKDTYGLAEVEPIIGGEGVTHAWSGQRITDVQTKTKVAAKVEGSYNGFSGEVEFAGSSASSKSATAYFSNMTGRYPKYVLRLRPRGTLRDLLLPQVREALDGWSKSELIENFFPYYGGYFVQNAVFGGSMNYAAVRTTSSTQSDDQFSASMKAAYDFGVGKASGSAHAENQKKASEFLSGADETLRARGGLGNLEFGRAGVLGKWQGTILKAPEMIDFDNRRGPGCCPVWSLVEDPARAAAVRDAFFEHALSIETKYTFKDPTLRPLYGYADWGSMEDLRRWFYSREADHKRGKNWTRKHGHIHVYPDARPGCAEFHCIRKNVSRGRWPRKEVILVHRISRGPKKGWEKISTFFAPDRPLVATTDTWVPIHEYTRKENGAYCGKHYNTASAKGVGGWTRGKLLFYAVVK